MAAFLESVSKSASALSRSVYGTASSSQSGAGGTAQGDVVIYLDKHTIDQGLPGWKEMESSVEIEFLGRGITNVLNEKHWAWLIKGKTFFCTIEYGTEGIVIQYFKKERGINTACAAIMGDSECVGYDDKFRTNMTFSEILQYADRLKTSWTAGHYNSIQHNCRDFVRVLGKKMDSTFNPPDAVSAFLVKHGTLGRAEITFPKSRTVA